jgi:Domain of unknown function (DUF4105)
MVARSALLASITASETVKSAASGKLCPPKLTVSVFSGSSNEAQEAWAEVKGDEVTLHNVRNCDYRKDTDYTPRWETRTVRLSQLTGLDLAINYWGSPWMAHPIASFQFANAPPLCFSIEIRRKIGENYSAIGGFFRQYELIYIVAGERDVIRVRTNFRRGEDVYLYRTTASPEKARERFMDTSPR